MKKYLISSLLLSLALLGGCAMPESHSTGAAASAVPSGPAAAEPAGNYRTVWVPPPVGSLLGGGYVRVATDIQGNDEAALLGTIGQLNAAGGTKAERPYVIAAVSRTTGVSERQLQAQQDILRLQFGQLCAINAIARGNSNNVQEIAAQKAKGKTWTELAKAYGVNFAMVIQMARNANQLTVSSYTNSAERAKGGQQKLKSIDVKLQPNSRPNG